MKDAVIVSAVRTAAGKAPNGTLRGTRPDELAATAIGEALRRAPGIEPAEIDDVILGCAMPEAEQGMNVARIASLRAGIPVQASAVTVNRFCSSGLQAIAYGAERVMCGFASAVVAGGTESMSLVPMGGHKIAPNPTLIADLSRRLPEHRPGRRKPRARVSDFARGTGRLRAPQPSARDCRDRRGPLRRGDRSGHGADGERRRRGRHGHVRR
jgi:acetyl-CoA acetyltransferase